MIKKADIYIILVVLSVILCAFFVSNFPLARAERRNLNIYSGGKLVYSRQFPFYDEIEITDLGYNKIIVKNETVYISESDCKGKDCIHFGEIKESGDFIICAPNKLIIRIENEKKEDFNAITY